MKLVDINWSIILETLISGKISFDNVARGKAKVAVADNFELKNKEKLEAYRSYNDIRKSEFTDEEILSLYLSTAWNKVLEEKFDCKFLNLAVANEELVLHYFNILAKSKNIGKMTQIEVEKFKDKDNNEKIVNLNGKAYRLTTITLQVWTLANNNQAEQAVTQKPEKLDKKNKEKPAQMKPVRNIKFDAEAMLDD